MRLAIKYDILKAHTSVVMLSSWRVSFTRRLSLRSFKQLIGGGLEEGDTKQSDDDQVQSK